MTKKSPALQRAEANEKMLQQGIVDQKGALQRRDMIIEDIRASELRLIADLDKANARIDELQSAGADANVDKGLAEWALRARDLQLQRALGWIDHADGAPLGLSRVNPAPTEETPDED